MPLDQNPQAHPLPNTCKLVFQTCRVETDLLMHHFISKVCEVSILSRCCPTPRRAENQSAHSLAPTLTARAWCLLPAGSFGCQDPGWDMCSWGWTGVCAAVQLNIEAHGPIEGTVPIPEPKDFGLRLTKVFEFSRADLVSH